MTFYRQRTGIGAGGDDYVVGCILYAIRHDSTGPGETCLRINHIHLGALHQRSDTLTQLADDLLFAGYDLIIIERECKIIYPEGLGFAKGAHHFRIAAKTFCGDAPLIEACASKAVAIEKGHTLPVACGSQGRLVSARTGSDNNNIRFLHLLIRQSQP